MQLPDNIFWFTLLSLLAEVLGTIGGFGSSLFFVPIAALFLDFHQVLGVTALFHVFSNTSKIYYFRKGFNKKIMLELGISSVLFVILGAVCSKFLNTKILELLLAIFLISISVVLYFFQNIKLEVNTRNSVLGGATSGFIAGIVGTGGAIRGAVLSSYNLPKEIFISTSAFIDLATDSARGVVYYSEGYITEELWVYIPVLLIVSIVGTYLGKILLQKISETQFKKIVLLLVFATGLFSLIKTL